MQVNASPALTLLYNAAILCIFKLPPPPSPVARVVKSLYAPQHLFSCFSTVSLTPPAPFLLLLAAFMAPSYAVALVVNLLTGLWPLQYCCSCWSHPS